MRDVGRGSEKVSEKCMIKIWGGGQRRGGADEGGTLMHIFYHINFIIG